MRHTVIEGPIGVFDSGYGGLTVLSALRQRLPRYDYLYLGDNARAPYGSRSFDLVYRFTLQAVETLFDRGCRLVVLACNTASAKALRSIQQNDLPRLDPSRRVLGVIRPTAETIATYTRTQHVGVLATEGTVSSGSYKIEIGKLNPDIHVAQLACPMLVHLVENHEAHSPGAEYFVKKYLDALMLQDPLIDAVILGCTHYPILMPEFQRFAPPGVEIIPQGAIVAQALAEYLERHPEMEQQCAKHGSLKLLTTENPADFDKMASSFIGHPVHSYGIKYS